MIPINTRLTKLLDVKTPVVLAPMGSNARAELVIAVTQAGGFGFLGASTDTSEVVLEQFRIIRERLSLKEDDVLPIGVGFLGCLLDKNEVDDPGDPCLDKALAKKPKAIWFAFGDDLHRWVKFVQDYDAKRDHKTLIFVIVNSVEEARRAANDWQVDGLVVQGHEAGGHGGSYAPPLSTLLSAVLKAIPEDGPVIIAAGGITTGTQIASMLVLGASGVALGTRFLLTPEAVFSPTGKEILLEADINSTYRGMAFDEARRTMFWPNGIDGRAIANKIVDDEREGLSLEERWKRYDEGKANGEKHRQVVWAGVGAGLIREIKSTSDIVADLHMETVNALNLASSLVP